jgi:methylmalonyl-CoA mutase
MKLPTMRELIEEVEELGGMTKTIKRRIPKLKLEKNSCNRKQARIDSGQDIM